jgi:Dockerin type I repeat.
MYFVKKSKSVLASVIMLVMVMTFGGFSAAAQETKANISAVGDSLVFGDANGDGLVNSTDYILLNKYVSGGAQTFPYDKAAYTMDVNVDGLIDSKDSDLVKGFLLGDISIFPGDEIIKSMPTVVFKYSYENFAWSHQQAALNIDSEGNISASSTLPLKPNPEITKIPKIEIQIRYIQLILASKGPYTDLKHTAYDAGKTIYSGAASNTGSYREILLKLSGDYSQDNLSPYAQLLVDWLKGIVRMYF